MNLSSVSPASVEFNLDKQVQELSRVTVYGTVPRKRPDIEAFLKRKTSGMGHYLTANDLQHAFSVSDAVRMVPGVKIVSTGRFSTLVFIHTNKCPADVYVGGVKVNEQFESIDDIPPNQIEGLEIYSGPLETPPRFQTISRCPVILIWRKW